jgi:hypothetical protein
VLLLAIVERFVTATTPYWICAFGKKKNLTLQKKRMPYIQANAWVKTGWRFNCRRTVAGSWGIAVNRLVLPLPLENLIN